MRTSSIAPQPSSFCCVAPSAGFSPASGVTGAGDGLAAHTGQQRGQYTATTAIQSGAHAAHGSAHPCHVTHRAGSGAPVESGGKERCHTGGCPRVRQTEVQPYTPEEAKKLLDELKDDRLSALYSAALAVGLRQGEALGLRWPDVDLDAGTLAVRNSLQRIDGKLQLVEVKTLKSRRTITLPKVATDALRKHRARQEQERQLAGTRWQEGSFVFTTSIGTPLEGSTVTHRFQAALKTAGLRRIRFHDLRHSCATLLLAQGVHPRVIMEILGHSQIGVTMNLYPHVLPAMRKEVVGQMDAILTPPPANK